jgi:hypothetical protein
MPANDWRDGEWTIVSGPVANSGQFFFLNINFNPLFTKKK